MSTVAHRMQHKLIPGNSNTNIPPTQPLIFSHFPVTLHCLLHTYLLIPWTCNNYSKRTCWTTSIYGKAVIWLTGCWWGWGEANKKLIVEASQGPWNGKPHRCYQTFSIKIPKLFLLCSPLQKKKKKIQFFIL